MFKRTLYMCSAPPSSIAGAMVILRNLFQDFPPDRLWMLVTERAMRRVEIVDGQPLPWRCDTVPLPTIEGHFIWRFHYPLRAALIPIITRRAVEAIRRHQIEAIFSAPYDAEMLVAAYLAHRRTGCDLHVYVMDDWVYNARRTHPLLGWLAERYMPQIARSATRLWAISPAMAQDFANDYDVKAGILWHSVDLTAFGGARAQRKRSPDGVLTVVGLGSIYGVNLIPLRNLLAAIDRLRSDGDPALDWRFRLYTTQPAEWLTHLGISPTSWLEIQQASPQEVPHVLAQADVLFLPLSFEEPWAQIVRTSFPTKLAEYLASGTPILVHAPSYATTVQYTRTHDCALIVDTQDSGALVGALRRLATDTGLRARLSANAVAVAERNHDRRRVVAEFLEAFRS